MATPRIGQAAVQNGLVKYFAGTNYGYQTPQQYNELEKKGKLKVGAQALDRLSQSVSNSSVAKQLTGIHKQFKELTDKIPGITKLEQAVNRASDASTKLPSSRVAQGGSALANQVAEYLNVDPRLAMVGMLAAGARKPYNPKNIAGAKPNVPGAVLNSPGTTPPATSRSYRQQVQANLAAAANSTPTPKPVQPKVTGQNIDARGIPFKTTRTGVQYPDPFHRARRPDSGRTGLSPETRERLAKQIQANRIFQAQEKSNAQYFPQTSRPASNKPADNPLPSPGNPRPSRIFVEGTGGVKRLETGYTVRPEDMAPPRGDGNNYGQFALSNEVPGYSASGQFVVSNNSAHNAARRAQRQGFLDQKAAGKAKALNQDAVRNEVWWADGDVDKLNAILKRLGGKEQRYASDAERAINKRLGAIENTYGGKTVLSEAERKALTKQWDWKNLQGITQPEVNRLNALANGEYKHLFKPILQQLKDNYFKGAQVPPEIQRRLDAMAEATGLRSRQQRTNPKAYTNNQPKRSDKADQRQVNDDVKVQASMAKPPYQPKLTDAEREAARRARAGRPLRSASLRINR